MIIIGITPALNSTAKVKSLYKGDAKAHKTFVLTIIAAKQNDSDHDPMGWNELDSFSNKPPKTERKPRKHPYKKPDAVKQLEQATGTKHRDDTASGLTRCIIGYLKYRGWQAERINTMGVPIDRRRQVTDTLGHSRTIGSVQWRRGGGTVGSADISATIAGRSVKIEVKVGRDRQSEAQRIYQQQVEQAGGLYYIAHNFTSFINWYVETFMRKGGQA